MKKQSEGIDEILEEWRWARSLSYDLLSALSEQDLIATPIKNCGSWGRQFRHLGRVQENYIQALKTGAIKFTAQGCSYFGTISKSGIERYLESMDEMLFNCASSLPGHVAWFGRNMSPERHLQALVSHEILHHGQFIIYARSAGLKLPKSWEVWGE